MGRELLLWRPAGRGTAGGRQEAAGIPGRAAREANRCCLEGREDPSLPRGGRGEGTELGNTDPRPGLASWLMSPWPSHVSSLVSHLLGANNGDMGVPTIPGSLQLSGTMWREAHVQEAQQVTVGDRMWGQEVEGLHYSGG